MTFPTRVRGWKAVAVIAIAWAAVATIGWIVRARPTAPAWGSVAEWATTIVAAAALVAAVWAGRSAQGQLEIMRDDALAKDRDARERLARGVFVTEQRMNADDVDAMRNLVFLHNTGGEPITSVELTLHGPRNANIIHMGTVMPSPGPLILPDVSELATDAIKTVAREAPEPFQALMTQTLSLALSVTFTDARGLRWQRMPTNELVERPADFDGDAARDAVEASVAEGRR